MGLLSKIFGSSSESTTQQYQQQVGVDTGAAIGAQGSGIALSGGGIAAGGSVSVTGLDRQALEFGALALGVNEAIARNAIAEVAGISERSLGAVAESATRTASVAEQAVYGAQATANQALQTALGNPNAPQLGTPTSQNTKLLIYGGLGALVLWLLLKGKT